MAGWHRACDWRRHRRRSRSQVAATGRNTPLGWLATIAISLLLSLPVQVHRAGRADAQPAPRPNVVLIVVDTLRADRFHALLETRLPYLRSLASRSTRFSRAWSTSSWTPTSTASIFTGLHPHQHGIRSGHFALDGGLRLVPVDRLSTQLTTLPMVLAQAGYRTLAVSDNVNIGETMGFARGFDGFVHHAYRGAARVAASAAKLWRGDRMQRDRRVDRADRADRRPIFLYLHFMDPHAPYHRRADYRAPASGSGPVSEMSVARARYDSELVYLDAQLGKLARKLAWHSDTLVIFTSDHGEAFGEHGQTGHPNQLHDELLRVPLMLSTPGQSSPRIVDGPVSPLDILPTLRAQLGLPSAALDAGIDLTPALAGGAVPDRPLLAMRFSDFIEPPLARRALIEDDYKVIAAMPSGRVELFDLERDPEELHDLSRSRPALLRQLSLRLQTLSTAGECFEPTRVPVEAGGGAEGPAGVVDGPASLAARLRALGYAR